MATTTDCSSGHSTAVPSTVALTAAASPQTSPNGSPPSSSFFSPAPLDGSAAGLVSPGRAHFRSTEVMRFEGRRSATQVWICDKAPSSPAPDVQMAAASMQDPLSRKTLAEESSGIPSSACSSNRVPQDSPQGNALGLSAEGLPPTADCDSDGVPGLSTSGASSTTASPHTPACHLGERPPFVHSDTVPDAKAGWQQYQQSCTLPVSRRNSVGRRLVVTEEK